jgi:hypothetical protein
MREGKEGGASPSAASVGVTSVPTFRRDALVDQKLSRRHAIHSKSIAKAVFEQGRWYRGAHACDEIPPAGMEFSLQSALVGHFAFSIFLAT